MKPVEITPVRDDDILVLRSHAADGEDEHGVKFSVSHTMGLGGLTVVVDYDHPDGRRKALLDLRGPVSEVVRQLAAAGLEMEREVPS